MRGLLACCALFRLVGCSVPNAWRSPALTWRAWRPTGGWRRCDPARVVHAGRARLSLFIRLPDEARQQSRHAYSGVLLSLAGMVTPEYTNRPMTVSGYVFDAKDPAGRRPLANPCRSSVYHRGDRRNRSRNAPDRSGNCEAGCDCGREGGLAPLRGKCLAASETNVRRIMRGDSSFGEPALLAAGLLAAPVMSPTGDNPAGPREVFRAPSSRRRRWMAG